MSLELTARPSGHPLSQGDILRKIQIADFNNKGAPAAKEIIGLVISHSCELDKEKNFTALVLGLLPIKDLPTELAVRVRAYEVLNLVHIGEVPDIGDCYADFRKLYRAAKPKLVKDCGKNRLAAISDEAFEQVVGYLVAFLTRMEGEEEVDAAQAEAPAPAPATPPPPPPPPERRAPPPAGPTE